VDRGVSATIPGSADRLESQPRGENQPVVVSVKLGHGDLFARSENQRQAVPGIVFEFDLLKTNPGVTKSWDLPSCGPPR